MPTPAPSDPVPHPADAPAYQYDETLEVSYSASLCCNNLSVAPSDGSQFHYSFVHKFGVVTGNQQASADVLKKPWTPVPNVPPGAVLLSMTVFQVGIGAKGLSLVETFRICRPRRSCTTANRS